MSADGSRVQHKAYAALFCCELLQSLVGPLGVLGFSFPLLESMTHVPVSHARASAGWGSGPHTTAVQPESGVQVATARFMWFRSGLLQTGKTRFPDSLDRRIADKEPDIRKLLSGLLISF